jgi:hypothetical protein
MRLLKLAQRYKEFATDASLILQSQFMMPLPSETGFIELKGSCPFKFEKQNISS